MAKKPSSQCNRAGDSTSPHPPLNSWSCLGLADCMIKPLQNTAETSQALWADSEGSHLTLIFDPTSQPGRNAFPRLQCVWTKRNLCLSPLPSTWSPVSSKGQTPQESNSIFGSFPHAVAITSSNISLRMNHLQRHVGNMDLITKLWNLPENTRTLGSWVHIWNAGV